MDFLVYIFLLLIGGCLGGFMAGLLGVGGGMILTPIQYYLLLYSGVDDAVALPLSFGTSLAVIFVTMIRSTKTHYDNNFVVMDFLNYIMMFGFVGAVCGAFISVNVDVSLVRLFFGLMYIFAVFNMVLIKYPDNDDNINKSAFYHSLLGLVGGLLCGLLGVGGGVIMIPILTLLLKYPTHKAIGTSSASIIATSLGGLLAYIVLGWNVPNLPEFCVGYVNLVQFVFLTLTSIVVSGYSARLSKKVDGEKLKIVHIIIVLYIGLKMIGIV